MSEFWEQYENIDIDLKAFRNLVELFELLLRVDMRNNPHLYKMDKSGHIIYNKNIQLSQQK